ncbi:MAG: 16S rRNA (cytosine(1402)-N(4))-methyltransferase RsmH, partial [Acidobacteria bacterium]|nr:16S rRNA (cytosine(1402)-N(4))-methyltransferase RsmH [Acidobacteriota bacterium]
MDYIHIPVMTREVCELLDVENGGNFVDCTVGLGGHAEAILSANPKSTLLGMDRDGSALEIAKKRLERFGDRATLIKCNFKDVNIWKMKLDKEPTGILADLGISSLQFEEGRGFSFNDSSSLDMRMDRSEGLTAFEFINKSNADEIYSVLKNFGEVENSRKIAKEIVERRKIKPIETGKDLASLVEVTSPKTKKDKIH